MLTDARQSHLKYPYIQISHLLVLTSNICRGQVGNPSSRCLEERHTNCAIAAVKRHGTTNDYMKRLSIGVCAFERFVVQVYASVLIFKKLR